MQPLHKGEWSIFLKPLFYTVLFFLVAGSIQLGIIVDEFKPQYVFMPIIISIVLGSLLGMNSVLRRRLQKANQVKTDFLSRVSHELRTPMTSIIGFSQYLRHQEDLQDKYRDQIGRIYASGEHLMSLINDLLDMTQIESGNIKLDMTQVDTVEVAKESTDIVAEMAKEADVTITNRLTTMELPFLNLDRVRFRQILINLLSNAIKYNKPEGSVIIDAEIDHSKQQVIFRVSDTGNGISEAFLPQVFERFTRDEGSANEVKGTGIGLTITKKLVQLMHGSIDVTSKEGEGSCFSVIFPIPTLKI